VIREVAVSIGVIVVPVGVRPGLVCVSRAVGAACRCRGRCCRCMLCLTGGARGGDLGTRVVWGARGLGRNLLGREVDVYGESGDVVAEEGKRRWRGPAQSMEGVEAAHGACVGEVLAAVEPLVGARSVEAVSALEGVEYFTLLKGVEADGARRTVVVIVVWGRRWGR
jgi:hypothetical protein